MSYKFHFLCFVSIFTHFLDEEGNIPKDTPEEARELASFHAFIVDEATSHYPVRVWNSDFSCFNKECDSNTITEFVEDGKKIWWYCPECDMEGVISEWQGSRWDNTRK